MLDLLLIPDCVLSLDVLVPAQLTTEERFTRRRRRRSGALGGVDGGSDLRLGRPGGNIDLKLGGDVEEIVLGRGVQFLGGDRHAGIVRPT